MTNKIQIEDINIFMIKNVQIYLQYKIMANEATFYIDDNKMANTLLNCDRKIAMTDGFKLQIRVKPSSPTFINNIDEKLKERLKQAMSKRFVQGTNALDLSKFHLDPG